jgi:hypothetical protein
VSELQLYLLAGGAVFVAAVWAYNVWQEKKARGRAEEAFGERPGDALFEPPAAKGPPAPMERKEPTLGPMPRSAGLDETIPPMRLGQPVGELEAPLGLASQVSSRIDTVAVILADDPVMSEQLEPLRALADSHDTPVHVEGIMEEQWTPVDTVPDRSWRELRVGLQLASRRGAVTEEEIERFNQAIADFAASVGAVSQREAPVAAAQRARDLDRFCAEADIEVAINVVGQYGATLAVPRVKALALEHGLSETGSGELVSFAADGTPEFTIRRFDDSVGKPPGTPHHTGLTFALDLPHVAEPAQALSDMINIAASMAEKLGGELVDDNRRPLTEAGLASIRRSLEKVVHDMEAHGVTPGSALARRLFS